jgi:transaldolase
VEIFLDTADIEEIRRYAFILDGVTTNPTLIAQVKGRHRFQDLIRQITAIVEGPVSVEAVSQAADELVREAEGLAALSPSVVVKVPMTLEGLAATRRLHAAGIRTNLTLIFSVNQAILAAKAGATYASIFVGRMDDIGWDGMAVVRDTVEVYRKQGWPTKVITASVRHPLHVSAAAMAGTHAITIPPKVLASMAAHNLTDAGLARFLEDWKRVTGQ